MPGEKAELPPRATRGPGAPAQRMAPRGLGLATEDCAAIVAVVAGMGGPRGTSQRSGQNGGA
ncbi:MAG: hypothetical protein HYV93_18570 [Candidatus Rokubacteria bacterium]|nr:hypothetical protein [Candidatus Rokubacteria bacterium]